MSLYNVLLVSDHNFRSAVSLMSAALTCNNEKTTQMGQISNSTASPTAGGVILEHIISTYTNIVSDHFTKVRTISKLNLKQHIIAMKASYETVSTTTILVFRSLFCLHED